MVKLNLVIADYDSEYLESFTRYLMDTHKNRFNVSTFSSEGALNDFLARENISVDILLASPEISKGVDKNEKIKTLIILGSRNIVSSMVVDVQKYEVVDKYQSGEKLVEEILHIFSEVNDYSIFDLGEKNKMKLVSVYSPIGGSGKTLVSLNLCVRLSSLGLSVFYLNLENFSSTKSYFNYDKGQTLSNVIFYIKERNKNLELKVEAATVNDTIHNIHYFSPLDSSMDMEDVDEEDISILIEKIRVAGEYDVCVVDMASVLDEKNRRVLELSDRVVILAMQGEIAKVKLDILNIELDWFKKKYDSNILDKCTVVMNKYNPNTSYNEKGENSILSKVKVKIPILNDFFQDGVRSALMEEYLEPLAERIYNSIKE